MSGWSVVMSVSDTLDLSIDARRLVPLWVQEFPTLYLTKTTWRRWHLFQLLVSEGLAHNYSEIVAWQTRESEKIRKQRDLLHFSWVPLYLSFTADICPPRLRDDKMGPPYGSPSGKALIGTPWSAPQSPGWFLKPVKLTMKTNHGVKTHHYVWQMLGWAVYA